MDSLLASCFEQRTFHGSCLENNTQYITTSPTQLECMLFPARRHCCAFEIACTVACCVFMALAAYPATGKPCASRSSTPPTYKWQTVTHYGRRYVHDLGLKKNTNGNLGRCAKTQTELRFWLSTRLAFMWYQLLQEVVRVGKFWEPFRARRYGSWLRSTTAAFGNNSW